MTAKNDKFTWYKGPRGGVYRVAKGFRIYKPKPGAGEKQVMIPPSTISKAKKLTKDRKVRSLVIHYE